MLVKNDAGAVLVVGKVAQGGVINEQRGQSRMHPCLVAVLLERVSLVWGYVRCRDKQMTKLRRIFGLRQ